MTTQKKLIKDTRFELTSIVKEMKFSGWRPTRNNITEINFTFPFTDRKSYLEYRKEWKAIYKELSEYIRFDKRLENMKKADKESDMESKIKIDLNLYLMNTEYDWSWNGHGNFGRNRKRLHAYLLLLYLAGAKKEAQRQYLASLNKE